jgi:uncharacterized protein YbaP (TraB family)
MLRLSLVMLIGQLCLQLLSVAHAQDVDVVESTAHFDEVVVTGERSGPRLWKVSSGEGELWILGVFDPLPKKMYWHSQQVDELLKESQAVLMDRPSVSPDANLFAKLGLYLHWRRLQKNPEGRTLDELLPADLYARFAVLERRYAAGDGLDKLRPIMAAARLYRKAVESIGLESRRAVPKQVAKLARQHDLKPQTVSIKVTEPRDLLDSLNKIPLDAEIRCLEATLLSLESDLNILTERANAWALGDVVALRRLLATEDRAACWDVILGVPRVKELSVAADQQWLENVESALQRNRTTLALRSMRDLLAPGGVLEQIRAKGYQITGP